MTLTQEEDAIVALDWGWSSEQSATVLLRAAREQLHAYFDGELDCFTLNLAPVPSTPYRARVWDALRRIPHGETRTYAELARVAGGSARSIGQASGCNPLPILIPCHRVVAAGHAGGFSAGDGVETKRFLLSLETARRYPQADGLAA